MTRDFRAKLLIGLLFVIFVGVSMGGALYTSNVENRDRLRNDQIQRDQDRDMCALLAALLPSSAPAGPASSWGQAQRQAIADYRAHRC